MLKKSIIIIFLFIVKTGFPQGLNKCATTQMVNKSITEDPRNLLAVEEVATKNNQWVNEHANKPKSVITIPIVVHIVHRSTHQNIGSGTNISDAQIEDAIRILNEDYSKTNPEFPNPPRNTFLNQAGNAQLQFCLAATDEDGNPTNGITRTSTTKNNFNPDNESNDMKRSTTGGKDGWDPTEYLNIWVCDLASSSSGGMILGYSYLPGSVTWQMWKDGLVVDFQWFGSVGAAQSSDGRTPTHEIGHYLGLLHTFCEDTDSNGNPICCDNDDNNWGGYIDDTPASKDIYWGNVTSFTNNNTCNDVNYSNDFNTNVLDMDENFMSYSNTTWMFTQEQVSVMNGTMNNYRASLKNSPASMNCSGSVGFNQLLDNNQIRIYPNPSQGKLIIHNLTHNKSEEIIVRDIIGSAIIKSNNYDDLISLNLSSFKDGIYFVEITTSQGKRVEKIILAK